MPQRTKATCRPVQTPHPHPVIPSEVEGPPRQSVIPSEVEGPPRRSESPHSTPLRTKNHPSPPCHSDEGRIPSPQRVSPANPAPSHKPPKYAHASSSTTTINLSPSTPETGRHPTEMCRRTHLSCAVR